MRARENPFAVDRVLSIRYRLLNLTWTGLLEKLQSLGYRAEIIGPEGSGKTTLLEDLCNRLIKENPSTRLIRIRREDSSASFLALRSLLNQLSSDSVLLLDGAEQMNRLTWQWFSMASRRIRGLVITAHSGGRMPRLVRCQTSPEILIEILDKLFPSWVDVLGVSPEELFERNQGNLRDALRECYDICSVK